MTAQAQTQSTVSPTATIMAHVKGAAPAKPVYTPGAVLKMDVAGALSRRITHIVAAADGGNISKRSMGYTTADYKAAVGGKNADSVAGAICYAVVAYLNGQEPLTALTGKGVTPWFARRVSNVFDGVKATNSCDETALRTYAGLIAHGIATAIAPPKAPEQESDKVPEQSGTSGADLADAHNAEQATISAKIKAQRIRVAARLRGLRATVKAQNDTIAALQAQINAMQASVPVAARKSRKEPVAA